MAYPGFPATYQPLYYPQQYQPQMPQQPAQQYQQTSQNGFIRVQNENEARMYPVAPGSSVTFINENAPYCYTKTVDMSQLDRPKFEKYRLVKEEDSNLQPDKQSSIEYATKQEVKDLQKIVEDLKAHIFQINDNRKENADI